MGLNRYLLSVTDNQNIISDIYEHWNSREWSFDARFVYSQLIHTTKWKFDFNVFRKNVR